MGCIFLSFLAVESFGQGKKPAKLDVVKVPKVVTETYIIEYPMTDYYGWYGYPAFSNESDWYGYDPYLMGGEYPEYYIVEFTKDKTPYKVIYSKNGKKIATHKGMQRDLPKAVSDAINKGIYKSWLITKEREEILREKDTDNFKVFKIVVEKAGERHALFYQSDGTLLIDRKLKS